MPCSICGKPTVGHSMNLGALCYQHVVEAIRDSHTECSQDEVEKLIAIIPRLPIPLPRVSEFYPFRRRLGEAHHTQASRGRCAFDRMSALITHRKVMAEINGITIDLQKGSP